jgi:GNAT superfamily N-acetyltransferase
MSRELDFAALERIESAAFLDLYRAAPDAIRASFRIDGRSVAGATCLVCERAQPAAIFRRACGLGVHAPVRESDLDQVVQHMDRFGEPYVITVAPHAKPSALPQWLKGRGFTPGYAFMKFSRATAAAADAATDFDVKVIGSERGVAFGQVVSAVFGLPDYLEQWIAQLPGRERWVCLLASAGDVPVAAAAAYIENQYAWFGLGATLPEFRRRGAQSVLLSRRLREAHARGASLAVTETGERVPDRPSNSYRNILRNGFQEMYLRQNYHCPARTTACRQ